jgi:predicted metal-dependent enzyme (double-stranded beta helix superfamily)
MFEVQEFIALCQAALKEHSPELAVKELMERVMSRPSEVEVALGTPTKGGITTLLRSDEFTVLNIIWSPGMALYPHNHNLWAVIGLYGGQEDNTFFRRNTKEKGLIRAGFKELQAQDAVVLGEDAIHAVSNPRSVFTGAIHVYGGDFFAQPRSEWESAQSEERPYSVERVMRTFAEANERWLVQQGETI